MTARSVHFASILAVSVALLAGCHSGHGQGLPPESGSGAPPPPAIPKLSDVSTDKAVASGTSKAAWTGSLYARHEAELGPKMTGVLSRVTVDEGDPVKKGQLLFRLDSAEAALRVSQAKAAVATAQVGTDAAARDFARASALIAKGSIAPATFDQARSGNDQARSSLEQAKVALKVAERAASDTAVYAPIDGVVTAKLKSVGETVTMMPPTVVLVVQDVERLELRASLPEKALAGLAVGTVLTMNIPTVHITRDVPVKRINPTIDPRTRTVEVVADVDNTDAKLKVGMLVEVSLRGAPPEQKQQTASNAPGEPAP